MPKPLRTTAHDTRTVRIGVAAARLAVIALELREEGWHATFTADTNAGTVSVTVALDPSAPPPEEGETE